MQSHSVLAGFSFKIMLPLQISTAFQALGKGKPQPYLTHHEQRGSAEYHQHTDDISPPGDG